jgi:hypothetical protein
MLSTIAIAAEIAHNCPSLPNFVKLCLKTISFRNFEIPLKIEILNFFGKKILVGRRCSKAYAYRLDF